MRFLCSDYRIPQESEFVKLTMYEEFIKQKSVELHKESIDRPGRPCYNGEQKGGGSMEIRPVLENKRQYMDLLFLADEQVEMIERYLDKGEMFVLLDPEVVG